LYAQQGLGQAGGSLAGIWTHLNVLIFRGLRTYLKQLHLQG
jgi:hypothetical protein